ncbi:MAG TPA: hypothetical protein VGX50_14015 [Longimicrobium sp.]|jgi:hypothetical protein|nr:hypothetical protein [Longimicrobium sp.]
MTDFTPASRPSQDDQEPLLDSFLREAIPEIKLALGDAIDRDNSRAIPDKYQKLLPVTTLVVTLRPDAAQAVAVMAAELEEDLTDSVMRHGSLYDRDYRVRLKEAGARGAPLFRVSVQPVGQPEPEPIVAAPPPPPPPEPARPLELTVVAPEAQRPPVPPAGETLFAGRSPDFVDPDATRVEGIGSPAAAAASFPAGRFELVVEEEDGTERERFPIAQAQSTVGRQTDKPELRSDIQLTGFDTVSRRQLALVWAEREGRPGFTVYNLGLNAIHVGEREVSGANARTGALDIAAMGENSTWVSPGEPIRIGGHGPVLRMRDTQEAEKEPEGGGGGLELHVVPPEDPDATRFG